MILIFIFDYAWGAAALADMYMEPNSGFNYKTLQMAD